MIRVAVAEDNLLVREGIVGLLKLTPEFEVVAVCEDSDSLLSALDVHPTDVVLTDIRMPPSGTDEGIRLATALREAHPDVGVVVISQHDNPSYALRLFEEGSDRRGYLLKEGVHDRAQLASAIRSVAGGGSFIDPKVVEALVGVKARSAHSALADLSPREREVLAEIAQGKSNAAIAESLFLTKRAVEKHINGIFFKLNLIYDEDVSKRVKATLLFLGEPDEVPRP
jgi:DNA-binding NarL/FixJ family response regulator